MSGALDILQVKKKNILKLLAVGTHLGGINLDFQLQKAKWWYLHQKSEEDLVKLLLTAPSIIATENPADISIISSRNPWGQPASPLLGLSLANLRELQGVMSSGGAQSQSWPPASHEGVLC